MNKTATTHSGLAELEHRLAALRRVGLAHLPTPLEPLSRLTRHLGGPRLWVKREDCTGLGFGGNKLRKLDYVLREAIENGADSIVSGGVVQSNSQRQVAAAAAKLGLACHLAEFHGRVKAPEAADTRSGNALLNRLFGATIHRVDWTDDRNGPIQALADDLTRQGKRPFVVPYGASSALGAIGYATAILEIGRQSAELGFSPKAIVVASGSGGTQAGLVLGADLALPGTEILGIDVDAEPDRVRHDVVRIGTAAGQMLDLPFAAERVAVVPGHAGPAYGIPSGGTIEAITLAARHEALLLDPVYSGKGLAGAIALVREGRWSPDDNIVFVATGGTPALFAYGDALRL